MSKSKKAKEINDIKPGSKVSLVVMERLTGKPAAFFRLAINSRGANKLKAEKAPFADVWLTTINNVCKYIVDSNKSALIISQLNDEFISRYSALLK